MTLYLPPELQQRIILYLVDITTPTSWGGNCPHYERRDTYYTLSAQKRLQIDAHNHVTTLFIPPAIQNSKQLPLQFTPSIDGLDVFITQVVPPDNKVPIDKRGIKCPTLCIHNTTDNPISIPARRVIAFITVDIL